MPFDFEVGVVLPGENREAEQTPRFQGIGFGGSEDFAVGRDGTVAKEPCKFPNIVKKSRVCFVTC